MDPAHEPPGRWQGLAPWLAATILALVYAPALRLGPVGEDLQWAIKGWVTPFHPEGWLHPFHAHFRPACRMFFTFGAHVFGDHWVLYRLAVFGFTALLFLAALRLLRRCGGLQPATAALVLLLWLASPFTDEVFFVTNQVAQIFYATGMVLVLWLRSEKGPPRRWAVVAAALLAFAGKEEAVVLPGLVLAQDWLLEGMPLPRAIRRAVPWLAATGAYLIVYRILVDFQASWFYAEPWLALPNLVTTWMGFWHVHSHVLGLYMKTLLAAWPLALLAALLTAVALLLAHRRGDRTVPFWAAAAVIALLPTLPANLNMPRYTFLAYLFFLVFAFRTAALLSQGRNRRVVAALFLVTAGAVAANDLLTTRGDLEDWGRFDALGRRLESELPPVLAAVRSGHDTVLVRGNDGQPLRELLDTPMGVFKIYFPRPDDPYGVVSVSSVLSWKLRREGIAVPRVPRIGEAGEFKAFLHNEGGFLPLDPGSANYRWIPKEAMVILHPAPLRSFDPQAFW